MFICVHNTSHKKVLLFVVLVAPQNRASELVLSVQQHPLSRSNNNKFEMIERTFSLFCEVIKNPGFQKVRMDVSPLNV